MRICCISNFQAIGGFVPKGKCNHTLFIGLLIELQVHRDRVNNTLETWESLLNNVINGKFSAKIT
jgi:hypothetical protein